MYIYLENTILRSAPQEMKEKAHMKYKVKTSLKKEAHKQIIVINYH